MDTITQGQPSLFSLSCSEEAETNPRSSKELSAENAALTGSLAQGHLPTWSEEAGVEAAPGLSPH